MSHLLLVQLHMKEPWFETCPLQWSKQTMNLHRPTPHLLHSRTGMNLQFDNIDTNSQGIQSCKIPSVNDWNRVCLLSYCMHLSFRKHQGEKLHLHQHFHLLDEVSMKNEDSHEKEWYFRLGCSLTSPCLMRHSQEQGVVPAWPPTWRKTWIF